MQLIIERKITSRSVHFLKLNAIMTHFGWKLEIIDMELIAPLIHFIYQLYINSGFLTTVNWSEKSVC